MQSDRIAGCRRGFTLIEVLVVVAIIALLLAILLPSLQRARQQTRTAVCMSNMRQLGVALTMYTSTYRGFLPDYGFSHGGSESPERSWFNTMQVEMGDKRRANKDRPIAHCPEDQSPFWNQPYPGGSLKRRCSYAINEYITGRITDEMNPAADYSLYNRIDRIERPSTTIGFVELAGHTSYAVSDHIHPPNWLTDPKVMAAEQVAIELHTGKANYTFIDGHASTHGFEQTYRFDGLTRVGSRFVPQWKRNMYDPKLGF